MLCSEQVKQCLSIFTAICVGISCGNVFLLFVNKEIVMFLIESQFNLIEFFYSSGLYIILYDLCDIKTSSYLFNEKNCIIFSVMNS